MKRAVTEHGTATVRVTRVDDAAPMSFHDATIRAQAERRTMVITTSAVREYRVRFHDGLAVFESRAPLIGNAGWGAWLPTYGIPASALISLSWRLES